MATMKIGDGSHVHMQEQLRRRNTCTLIDNGEWSHRHVGLMHDVWRRINVLCRGSSGPAILFSLRRTRLSITNPETLSIGTAQMIEPAVPVVARGEGRLKAEHGGVG